MRTSNVVTWIVVALVVVGLGVFLLNSGGSVVTDVDAERMGELVTRGVRVIDVRTEGEYALGHIPGAVLVLVSRLEEEAAASWDREEPLAVYCAVGSRSGGAVATLERLGFTQIYHLAAGIVAWNGEIEKGVAPAVDPGDGTKPATMPVMYEFFTDG